MLLEAAILEHYLVGKNHWGKQTRDLEKNDRGKRSLENKRVAWNIFYKEKHVLANDICEHRLLENTSLIETRFLKKCFLCWEEAIQTALAPDRVFTCVLIELSLTAKIAGCGARA